MDTIYSKDWLLGGLFIIMSFLFTRSFFSLFFMILLGLLILVAFLKENNRLFVWMIVAFFLGNLLIGYADHFIGAAPLSPFSFVLISQLLWTIPILLITYVIKKFNKPTGCSYISLIRNSPIQITSHFTISFYRLFYFILTLLLLSIILVLVIKAGEWTIVELGFILLFSGLNSFLEEFLWRGILCTQFIRMSSERMGILLSSATYGLYTTMFGYSIKISVFYFLLGVLFGFVTVKSKSLLPSFFIHSIITILLLLLGWVVIPL
ncbi:type II CAAX endopeptidase family protein [Neobacillus rhizosphaerae]|uniref:CPBP family intramembrane glutamic endopeptidase n=1 Tax=Neobacillus rhizosphaerae TaxID=2880965 RepID=UPI003D2BB5E2